MCDVLVKTEIFMNVLDIQATYGAKHKITFNYKRH